MGYPSPGALARRVRGLRELIDKRAKQRPKNFKGQQALKEVLGALIARRPPQTVLTKQSGHDVQRHQWRPEGAPSAEQIERRISDPLFGAGGGFPLRA